MITIRTLLALWLLMMVVIVNAYASCMTALMTVPKMEPLAVDSLNDLATSRKIKLTIAVNTVPANTFLVSIIFFVIVRINEILEEICVHLKECNQWNVSFVGRVFATKYTPLDDTRGRRSSE